jgi:hypothetical protein
MPWELQIRRADGQPLGDREADKQGIARAFKGIQFLWNPSGPEKIAAAAKVGIEFPEVLRKHFETAPSTEQGDYDAAEWSIQFHLGCERTLTDLDADVRGETGQAIPILQRMATLNQWTVSEHGAKEPCIT